MVGKRVHRSYMRPLQKEEREKRYQSGEDRISQLPDDILVCILSYLTLKEAAATSVLSTRWTYLWMFTSRLNFDADSALDKIALDDEPNVLKRERRKYVKWVKGVLQLHKSSMLEEFRICFDLDKISKNSINKWLEFALSRGVQSLELDLLLNGNYIRYFPESYTFPSEFLSKSSHGRCEFVGYKSLKSLCLKCVNVSGEVLEFFLSNCPVLERLVVHGSGDLVNLEVTGPSVMLKYLDISECYALKSVRIIEAIHLVSLKLFGIAMDVLLKDVPLLTEVAIDIGRTRTNTLRDAFSKLSCCLHQLEVLTVDTTKAEKNMELLVFPELTKLKKLVLATEVQKDTSLLGFTSLIRASPHLEMFVLQVNGSYFIYYILHIAGFFFVCKIPSTMSS